MVDSTASWAIGCTVFCVIFITSCALLGSSFDTLEPTQMGIIFDKNVQHLDTDKLYYNGRYLTGLGRQFIGFPLTYQTIRFGRTSFDAGTSFGNIVCRSRDGLSIQVEVSFQYMLYRNASDLWRLYMDLGTGYNRVYGLVAQQVVQDVMSDYYTLDFFQDREVIEADMHAQLHAQLVRLYASVASLELMRVNIEDTSPTLVDAVENTQIAIQDVFQAVAEQNVAQVQADAQVGVATEVAKVQLLNANATAISYLAAVQANADALLYRVAQQATALSTLRDQLGLNTSVEILAYNWLTAMHENTVPNLLMGLKYPDTLINAIS